MKGHLVLSDGAIFLNTDATAVGTGVGSHRAMYAACREGLVAHITCVDPSRWYQLMLFIGTQLQHVCRSTCCRAVKETSAG